MFLIKIVFLLLLSCFTILLFTDYFPQISPSFKAPGWLIRSTMISVFIMAILWVKNEKCCNQSLNWLIIFTGYIFLLIAILTKVGVDSSSGVSFYNPFIWILLIISLLGLVSKSKKLKVQA